MKIGLSLKEMQSNSKLHIFMQFFVSLNSVCRYITSTTYYLVAQFLFCAFSSSAICLWISIINVECIHHSVICASSTSPTCSQHLHDYIQVCVHQFVSLMPHHQQHAQRLMHFCITISTGIFSASSKMMLTYACISS